VAVVVVVVPALVASARLPLALLRLLEERWKHQGYGCGAQQQGCTAAPAGQK
jgi:hypothetical protein